MAKDFARSFYGSKAWEGCRLAYKKSVGGLCERCMKAGIIRAGEMVHHKIHLTEETIKDPAVALNFDNLELLCRDCHAAEHAMKKRYVVDANGYVYAKQI